MAIVDVRKKVLIVNDGFPPRVWGSAHSLAFMHARGLQARGYEVFVFTTTQGKSAKIGWSEYAGLRVRTFYTDYDTRLWGYFGVYNPQITAKFKEEVDKIKPDIVHFHNIHNYFSYHAVLQARRSGAMVFMTMHDVMSFTYQKLDQFIDRKDTRIPTHNNYQVSWLQNFRIAKKRFNPIRNFLVRRYLAQADKLFAVSGALRDALTQNGIGNVDVVHNGVAPETFERPVDTESLRQELGLGRAPLILFMGRLTPPKGSEVLFEAMQMVLKKLPRARLLAVGFALDAGMQKALDRFGVSSAVVVVPSVMYEEVYKYYQLADAVVFPSICFDTFGMVNIEAGASGKPVVATCFGGSPEIIKDGVTGYIVNPLDTKSLAEKMLFLLEHPDKAREMGERGRARVQEHFTLERMLDGYLRYY